MKKTVVIFGAMFWMGFCVAQVDTAAAQGALSPGSITGYKQGTRCDEKPFRGDTANVLLKLSGGKDVDGIEIIYYPKKEKSGIEPYKAKRLHISAMDRKAYPALLDNGECALIRDWQPPAPSEINKQLLTTEERLEPAPRTEFGRPAGKHYTVGVYRIIKE